jgi:hypothetical protein
MDTTAILQALKAVTDDRSSFSETEVAQLNSACTDFVSATQAVERKLMDLIFAVWRLTAS